MDLLTVVPVAAVVIIALAVGFSFVNGFHDAANVVATMSLHAAPSSRRPRSSSPQRRSSRAPSSSARPWPGPSVSIATLAFCQVLFTLSMALPGLTGSEEGIRGIPKFLTSIEAHYYFSFFLLLALLFVLEVLFRTPFGIRLMSIREDERLSEAAGIDTSRYKIVGTSISAFMAGVAGAYSCYFHSHVSPDTLSIGLTFSAVAAVVFGGLGTLWGAFVGAYVLTFLNEYLYFMMEYRLLVYPLAIMLILLFSPGGLLGLFSQLGRIFQHGNAAGAKPDQEL